MAGAMLRIVSVLLAISAVCVPRLAGASLEAFSEFQRIDPFGTMIGVDATSGPPGAAGMGRQEAVNLVGARRGYVSFRLAAKIPEGGAYALDIRWSADGGVQTDVFREWFHFTPRDKRFYPDALVPVRLPYQSALPEPDNKIEKQTVQTFWVDLWIPAGARPGTYRAEAILEAAGRTERRPIVLKVLAAEVPEKEAVTMDHNSYGTSWLGGDYPKLRQRLGEAFFASDEFFRLIHSYHRVFYEHLGVFHQLGYGHGGKVGPEFAPVLEGSGRSRKVANWDLYDRHYAPLLDGTAFAGTRRGPMPIPYVYLPINPEWPASYLWWGEPGYETEFVNVVRQMEQHFREKGWTRTEFEMFFNHKKRYKAFPWDGDETRFVKDNRYFIEYRRLLTKALPSGTPVRFRFRTDASWMMRDQFRDLAGVIDFWVLGGSELSWYKEAPAMLKKRGDIVWAYGGTPAVFENSAASTFEPLRCWMWGIDGFVRWLTTSAGGDPWFRFGGGETVLVYPGERFGLEAPIASLRLKIQRNAVQDLTLLNSLGNGKPVESLKAEAARRYNGSSPRDWWPPRPAAADMPADEMTNNSIAENATAIKALYERVNAGSWSAVRSWILELASEVK